MSDSSASALPADASVEMVTVTIDGTEVQVPKGTNLIEAAKIAGTDVPYYCYHRHLSIAGNCRMCQVEIEGARKLEIACNTGVRDGMVVKTQKSSEKVREAQRATLEFLLINHPLDCTVCDQAGHCKLQDYYYDYNRKPSRFIEQKVNKVKAEVLGPEIIYDGERCIVCTRCVRFCDEVSQTSELGVFNRGDRAVIGIHPDKPLKNPLAGCVVDLCPVGALTHRRWRFNTRIWYTDHKDTICTGCSTGCNAKVFVRDGKIVQVKGRLNSDVNQEWMCDEGRYGFERFQPPARLTTQYVREGSTELREVDLTTALAAAAELKSPAGVSETAVFLSPFLTLEEVWSALQFADKVMGVAADSSAVAMQLVRRSLTDVEKVLVSPDYAPNSRAMNLFGVALDDQDWRAALEHRYRTLLSQVRSGGVKRILILGVRALLDEDLDDRLVQGILDAEVSVALTPRGLIFGEPGEPPQALGAHQLCKVVLPSRTVNEKNGVMVTQQMRFQRLQSVLTAPFGSYPDWMLLKRIAEAAGKPILPNDVVDDRAVFRKLVDSYPPLAGLTLANIGQWGIGWRELKELQKQAAAQQEAPA